MGGVFIMGISDIVKENYTKVSRAVIGLVGAALIATAVGCSTPPPKPRPSTQQQFLQNPERFGEYDLGNGIRYTLDKDSIRITMYPSADRSAHIELVGDKNMWFDNPYADRLSVKSEEVDVVATAGRDVSMRQMAEPHNLKGVRGSTHSAEFGVDSEEYETHAAFFRNVMHYNTTRLVNGVLAGRIITQQERAHDNLRMNDTMYNDFIQSLRDKRLGGSATHDRKTQLYQK